MSNCIYPIDQIAEALNMRPLGYEIDNSIPADATQSLKGELNPFWGCTHTPEVRARLSKVASERVHTEEYKQNMSESLKRRNAEHPRPQEWCDNLSKARTGFKKSEEHIENHRRSLIEGGKVSGKNNGMYGRSVLTGRKWYNDGIKAGLYFEGQQPDGYIKGRLK